MNPFSTIILCVLTKLWQGFRCLVVGMFLFLLFYLLSPWSYAFPHILLLFVWFRWENCITGCDTVSVWRIHVYICVPVDSCFEPKWRGHSTWFYLCDIHVVFNAWKLPCISADGSPNTQSGELYADCLCHLSFLPPASHCDQRKLCWCQGLISLKYLIILGCFLTLLVLKQFLVAPSKVKGGSISFAGCIQLLGFCAFEACVGLFWPSIMKMRSQYIPEEARSTIMNFFRIPLNIFVCIVLYNVCFKLYL